MAANGDARGAEPILRSGSGSLLRRRLLAGGFLLSSFGRCIPARERRRPRLRDQLRSKYGQALQGGGGSPGVGRWRVWEALRPAEASAPRPREPPRRGRPPSGPEAGLGLPRARGPARPPSLTSQRLHEPVWASATEWGGLALAFGCLGGRGAQSAKQPEKPRFGGGGRRPRSFGEPGGAGQGGGGCVGRSGETGARFLFLANAASFVCLRRRPAIGGLRALPNRVAEPPAGLDWAGGAQPGARV